MSFDVFRYVELVRDSADGAFERILADARAPALDVKAFWNIGAENIGTNWDAYRSYREICELSLPKLRYFQLWATAA